MGLLFNKTLESGPPFGGSQTEYKMLFKSDFESIQMTIMPQSVISRAIQNSSLSYKRIVTLPQIYMKQHTIIAVIQSIKLRKKLNNTAAIINSSANIDYIAILTISTQEISIESLEQIISDDVK